MLENLKHKERSIKDLATFLNNRPGEFKQALYCMLIGAGASATSGIRTGQDLIKDWRKQVLKKFDSTIDIEALDDAQIKSKIYEFYEEDDKENEYSALFGKIYDLRAQRRNFIEQEVAKAKSPSIGYQYLNLLAEDRFIETFFTTNFDDLLELSLSPLNSKERPIVCAQDSSVSNISITSHRTKIIKLHGDFLYNDLRSAPNETTSLENNMKAKFSEFLKNFGLIVLGYAGNDKSVMDCLSSLLDPNNVKNNGNEYLNNGLYWCIRKEDYDNGNISKKVLDLLSKDKVYYVIIDGFDEFCAELTHEIYSINGKDNVVFHKSHERQFQELEEYYNTQKEIFQDNLLILNDIKNCISDTSNTDSVTNISKTTSDLSGNRKYDDSNEKQNVVDNAISKDIRKLINRKDFSEALELIDNEISNINLPSSLYNYYNSLKIECHVSLKQLNTALETIEKAILYNEKYKKDSNVQLLLEKSVLASKHSERLNAIRNAISIDKYNYVLWNRLADELTDNEYELSKNKTEIMNCYQKSIELNSLSDNDAFTDRIDFLESESDENNYNEILNICDETVNILADKDPFSTACLKAKFEKIHINIKNNSSNNEEELKLQAKKIFEEYINDNKIYERNLFYIDMYLNFCAQHNYIDEIKTTFKKYDSMYNDSILYIVRKAKLYLKVFRDLSSAIYLLESIDSNLLKYSLKERDRYFYIYITYLLFDKQYEKAYNIYNENVTQNMRESKSLETDILYNIDKNKYIDIIIKDFEDSNKDIPDYIAYTYALLNVEYYDEICDVCKKLFNTNNPDMDINNPVLRINYNMAKKYGSRNSKITKTNLESVFKLKDNSFVKAAGYILLDEQSNAEKIFKQELLKNYEHFYYYQKMPIFKFINFEELKLDAIPIR